MRTVKKRVTDKSPWRMSSAPSVPIDGAWTSYSRSTGGWYSWAWWSVRPLRERVHGGSLRRGKRKSWSGRRRVMVFIYTVSVHICNRCSSRRTTTTTRLDSKLPHGSASFTTRLIPGKHGSFGLKDVLGVKTVGITPLPQIQHQWHFHQHLPTCLRKPLIEALVAQWWVTLR